MKAKVAAFALFWVYAGSTMAAADTPPRPYAVISLIGDSITVVGNRTVTGSLIDRNPHQVIELPPPGLDNAALLAADDALRKANPAIATELYSVSSKVLRERQSQLIDGGHLVASAEISDLLKNSAATHLLLITKHRATTALHTDREEIGNGTLYGLGYYVDFKTRLFRTDDGQGASGYLAPYAYFNIYIVDLKTAAVLEERTVVASNTIPNANNKVSSSPWDILSGDEKIATLDRMVRRQIMDSVPLMLQDLQTAGQ